MFPLTRYRYQLWYRLRHLVYLPLPKRGARWLYVVSRARTSGCPGVCPPPGGNATFRMCSGRIVWSFMGSASLLPRLSPNRVHFHGTTAILIWLTRCCSGRGEGGDLGQAPVPSVFREPATASKGSAGGVLDLLLPTLTAKSALFPSRFLACVDRL